jgi:hypothetical protein
VRAQAATWTQARFLVRRTARPASA